MNKRYVQVSMLDEQHPPLIDFTCTLAFRDGVLGRNTEPPCNTNPTPETTLEYPWKDN